MLPRKFRLARVAERFVKECEKKGPTLGMIQQWRKSRRPSDLLCVQLGSCAEVLEANIAFAGKEAWDLPKNVCKVKGTYVQACDKFFRPPNRTTEEKVVFCRLDSEHEDRECIVDSCASLHMMRENGLTSGEKETM